MTYAHDACKSGKELTCERVDLLRKRTAKSRDGTTAWDDEGCEVARRTVKTNENGDQQMRKQGRTQETRAQGETEGREARHEIRLGNENVRDLKGGAKKERRKAKWGGGGRIFIPRGRSGVRRVDAEQPPWCTAGPAGDSKPSRRPLRSTMALDPGVLGIGRTSRTRRRRRCYFRRLVGRNGA
jgi:hypothetical protein